MPLGQLITLPGGTERYECSHCGHRWATPTSATTCCVFHCDNCGTEHRYQEDANYCCEEEVDSDQEYYECPDCGYSEHETQEAADECCNPDVVRDRYGQRIPDLYPPEVLELEAGYTITIPELVGRPVRVCSVEQELSTGGAAAAKMLFDMGIGTEPFIVGYGQQGNSGYCLVKEDNTIRADGGGEVVYSRFDLSRPNFWQKFSTAIWRLREMRRLGIVSTQRNAGTHFHIAARAMNGLTVGPAQMANLYEIFSFCEDVMFRLGSAGWKSHRGTQHTIVMPKYGAEVTPSKVAKNTRRDRHFSLNFTRLLNAARECTCGSAQVGDWQDCDCGVMNKGTVEWRVFNATTKPETMHGWLLLCHGLTAKAFNHTLGTLPEPNGYDEYATPGIAHEAEIRHPWIFSWILNECPFTRDEKDVLIALAKRSPGLMIDWDDFERQGHGILTTTDEDGDEH